MNMIVSMIFHNPIINSDDELIINYPNVNIQYWQYEQYSIYNNGVIKEILNTLNDLDCTKLYNNKQIYTTNDYRYKYKLSYCYHLLLKLNNQLLYNKFIDDIINKHINNIIFEYNNAIIVKKNNIKHKKAKNKFVKYTTRNIITDDIVYKYINNKTGEEYESSNPNLEEELNKPKRKIKEKVKRDKVVKVKYMIFKI